jgi:hypothetical protein
MATDGLRLIKVSVIWRHSDQARRQRLAEAVLRTYLRHPKGANGRAKGHP